MQILRSRGQPAAKIPDTTLPGCRRLAGVRIRTERLRHAGRDSRGASAYVFEQVAIEQGYRAIRLHLPEIQFLPSFRETHWGGGDMSVFV